MLGIVIGVGAVVLMMAIGGGSRRAVEEAVNSLGSNILMVLPGSPAARWPAQGRPVHFEMRDAIEMGQLPHVQAAAPVYLSRPFPAAAGKFADDLQITATTPDYFVIREWPFAEGGPFTGDDVLNGARVAVIGSTVVDKVFQGETPVGRTMTIKGLPFQIVGVLARKGPGVDGRDQDDMVFIPVTTGETRLWGGPGTVVGFGMIIYVKADAADDLDEASENIRAFLRQRFKLSEAAPDCFSIHNLSSLMQVATDTTKAFSTLLGAIASISLLVGGIGIMNIMLVNVTERIREIGIRKAVGATERQILLQFLLEAILITSTGSIIGLILGLSGGFAAERWLSIAVEFDLSMILLAVGVATLVGVASGFYPAYKAARMQPIEALRVVGA